MIMHEMKPNEKVVITIGDIKTIEAEYDSNIDHVRFCVKCKEIAENIANLLDREVELKYQDISANYTFKGKILGLSNLVGQRDGVEIIATSPIKKQPFETEFRVPINFRAKIYKFEKDPAKLMKGVYVGDGQTIDISKNAIHLWSDVPVDDPPETMFTIEMPLPRARVYNLPALLIQNQRNTATRTYAYDYIFNFDYSLLPGEQERFLLAILDSKMRS